MMLGSVSEASRICLRDTFHKVAAEDKCEDCAGPSLSGRKSMQATLWSLLTMHEAHACVQSWSTQALFLSMIHSKR